MMLLRSQLSIASHHPPQRQPCLSNLPHAALSGSFPRQTPPSSNHGLLRVPSARRCKVYCVLSHQSSYLCVTLRMFSWISALLATGVLSES